MTHPSNIRVVGHDAKSHSGPGVAPNLTPPGDRALEVKDRPTGWHWPGFSRAEMACRHCGELYHWPKFMDRLQAARDQIGRPFHILSAHRCGLHNARVGGAPKSQHLRLAVDIALRDHDRVALHAALVQAGFTGFGFYTTFIHADMGPTRQWFGTRKARTQWQQD